MDSSFSYPLDLFGSTFDAVSPSIPVDPLFLSTPSAELTTQAPFNPVEVTIPLLSTTMPPASPSVPSPTAPATEPFPSIEPAQPPVCKAPSHKRDWETTDITGDLSIASWSDEDVRIAINVHKDACPGHCGWHSKGTTTMACPRNRAHRAFCLRFRCAQGCCTDCTLETRYVYCHGCEKVFRLSAGTHTPVERPRKNTQTRYGIDARTKKTIAALADSGLKPQAILQQLCTDGPAPSLRQIQNYVHRQRQKSLRSNRGIPGQWHGLEPAQITKAY
ncbi:hypothetical protein J8273_7542 [Carpediemonas membranifera]|uniref:Uncharacterized protein n=1 Tax=Carpediemonas membranifera TaxID=201153 RepID=A0A8J6DZV5_9EUKA|nr:hypothetical protein J8273_7542 [Carpediemonas membranifera]|eukprot:KAG9391268.1 hypothetical protein J8273_7542 [Carpediemonas membranifera]